MKKKKGKISTHPPSPKPPVQLPLPIFLPTYILITHFPSHPYYSLFLLSSSPLLLSSSPLLFSCLPLLSSYLPPSIPLSLPLSLSPLLPLS